MVAVIGIVRFGCFSLGCAHPDMVSLLDHARHSTPLSENSPDRKQRLQGEVMRPNSGQEQRAWLAPRSVIRSSHLCAIEPNAFVSAAVCQLQCDCPCYAAHWSGCGSRNPDFTHFQLRRVFGAIWKDGPDPLHSVFANNSKDSDHDNTDRTQSE